MFYVGVDEAGRGPMIGPLVVTAIAIPEEDIQLLEEHKITDSKKITKKNREVSFKLIEKYSKERDWKIYTTICNAIDIDLAMETSNLNILETELFAKSINQLNLNSEGKGKIILDACDIDEKRFGDRVSKKIHKWPWKSWKLISKHKADTTDRIVGAASIVAKVTRDKIIKEIGKEIGLDIGSGYPSDPKSKSALIELCKGDKPHNCLRWNWSSIRKYWIQNKKNKMPKRQYSDANWKNVNQHRLSEF